MGGLNLADRTVRKSTRCPQAVPTIYLAVPCDPAFDSICRFASSWGPPAVDDPASGFAPLSIQVRQELKRGHTEAVCRQPTQASGGVDKQEFVGVAAWPGAMMRMCGKGVDCRLQGSTHHVTADRRPLEKVTILPSNRADVSLPSIPSCLALAFGRRPADRWS